MNTQSLFEQFAETCRPKETLKMYTFKPTMTTSDPDEMETVVAPSLGEAIRMRPDMMKWYLHTITK